MLNPVRSMQLDSLYVLFTFSIAELNKILLRNRKDENKIANGLSTIEWVKNLFGCTSGASFQR